MWVGGVCVDQNGTQTLNKIVVLQLLIKTRDSLAIKKKGTTNTFINETYIIANKNV